MSYNHLRPEERYYIDIELKKGTSQNKMAKSLGRSQGSISRELARNLLSVTFRGYALIIRIQVI
jgi:IS30 family transposase